MYRTAIVAMVMIASLPAAAKVDPVQPETGAMPRQDLPQPRAGITSCVLPVPPEKRRWISWAIRNKAGVIVAAGAMEIGPRCAPAAGQ
jgi:hypothetical protein